MTNTTTASLLVISPLDAQTLRAASEEVADDDNFDEKAAAAEVLSEVEERLDAVDDFNHPRLRRALILQQLVLRKKQGNTSDMEFLQVVSNSSSDKDNAEDWTQIYQSVHTPGILQFLSTAWERWEASGQDPSGGRDASTGVLLIPSCVGLHRDPWQRPSEHVLGQMGYYCTDEVTPVTPQMVEELQTDAAMIQAAVQKATSATESPGSVVVYVIPTHPGHHASADAFGGYCYVNHVAAMARALQRDMKNGDSEDAVRVVILDVDYHAGNGTASIFYEDPSVLVVSLHCDPNFDYPFHSGFADETGHGEGEGATLHLPMPPGTTWESNYQAVLQQAMTAIQKFTPSAVIISLGLDTYDKDPCAIRRAGFCLKGKDYKAMGRLIAEELPPKVPVIFLQEGGYRMDKIGEAAADVVTNFCQHRSVA